MTDRRILLSLGLGLSVFLCGCTHFMEARAITAFTEAMQQTDLEDLRQASSSDFEHKALRRAEALDDLQILRLPEEPPSVVEVRDVTATEKEVTVQVGETSRQLLYKLIYEKTSNRWVVDDIYTKQKRSDVKVTKAVSEQMDLLLTIREFLEAWERDDRAAVLGVTTPEFRDALAGLPASWLVRLTGQAVGESERNKSNRHYKPQARIDNKTAIVSLPRNDGTLRLTLQLDEDRWQVDDVAIKARRSENSIMSLREHAQVIVAGTAFVEAFQGGDLAGLEKLTTGAFFDPALRTGDLTSVSLPNALNAPENYELKITKDHATLLVPTSQKVMKLDFRRFYDETSDGDANYRVAEVTLYEMSSEDRMRLSAWFTASQRVETFHALLMKRDLTGLGRVSTADFKSRVWDQAAGVPLQLLPMHAAMSPVMGIEETQFRGALTRVVTRHAEGTVTYILREGRDRLVIDDLLVQDGGTDWSLKKRLELALPIIRFAAAVQDNQVDELKRVCSREFGRLVWEQVRDVPDMGLPVINYLTTPVAGVKTQPGRARVELGTPNQGAVVSLISEHEHWVIDEVELIAGVEPGQRMEVKRALRMKVAYGNRSMPVPADAQSPMMPESPAIKLTGAEMTAEKPAQPALQPRQDEDAAAAALFAPLDEELTPVQSTDPGPPSAGPVQFAPFPGTDVAPQTPVSPRPGTSSAASTRTAPVRTSARMPTRMPTETRSSRTESPTRPADSKVTDPALSPIAIPR